MRKPSYAFSNLLKFGSSGLLGILLSVAQLNAQSASCASCRVNQNSGQAITYTYRQCTPTGVRVLCTNDPNSADPPVEKMCLPAPIFVNDNLNLPPDAEVADGLKVIGDANEYFAVERLPGQVTQIINEWQSICSPHNNTNCTPCTLWVEWSVDPRHFENSFRPNPMALISGYQGCSIQCNKRRILLNASPQFYSTSDPRAKEYDYPSNWFYDAEFATATTREFFRAGFTSPRRSTFYEMKTLLRRQIGLWLGFDVVSTGGCNESQSIMTSYFPPSTDDDLFAVDRCMFRLLYCCSPVSVDEASSIGRLTASPNPTTKALRLSTDGFLPVRYEIINVVGEKIASAFIESPEFLVELEGLPAGTYTIRVFDHQSRFEQIRFALNPE